MEFELLKATFFTYTLLLPRMLAAFAVLPFMGKSVMGGAIIRNGVVASLALMVFPVMDHQLDGIKLEVANVMLIILKEVFIGVVIGYLATIPFWAIEAAGFFIDNQRGSTMASSLNPLSGSQASPIGILLVQAVTTVFFVSGIFLLFLSALYASYVTWPVTSFYPDWLNSDAPLFFIKQMDILITLTVIFSAPAIIAMFLSEFGLGLISRFSPQLNVFFLAMPIKSAVAIAVLMIYLTTLIGLFGDYLRDLPNLFHSLESIF
ncbi:MAG: type III secretion protein T [Psychrobacter glaciei]|jgi:type III secretion protein T